MTDVTQPICDCYHKIWQMISKAYDSVIKYVRWYPTKMWILLDMTNDTSIPMWVLWNMSNDTQLKYDCLEYDWWYPIYMSVCFK